MQCPLTRSTSLTCCYGLNCVFPKRDVKVLTSVLQNVTLFGNRVSIEVNKIKWQKYVQYDWSLDVKGKLGHRDKLFAEGGPWEDTQGKCPVNTEGEEMQPQSRGHQGLQGEQETEEVRKAPPLTHQRAYPQQQFALRPAASRNAIEDIPAVLSHLVFGTLSWQP